MSRRLKKRRIIRVLMILWKSSWKKIKRKIMPNINVSMFDSPPSVGDRVTVTGDVQSIDKDGNVEISYDEVTSVPEENDETDSKNTSSEALDEFMKNKESVSQ